MVAPYGAKTFEEAMDMVALVREGEGGGIGGGRGGGRGGGGRGRRESRQKDLIHNTPFLPPPPSPLL